MLDNRLRTFLEVCKYQSYTKATKALHITQPVVSQQIRHLEGAYGTQLIVYENKKLRLTAQGEKLRTMATAMQADSKRIQQALTA